MGDLDDTAGDAVGRAVGRADDDVVEDTVDPMMAEPYDITEYLPEDFDDDPDDDRPRTQLKRVGRGGQMIGAAMIGLAEILQPKPKQEIPIEIATPGEPPNIDTGGLDEEFGAQGERLVGPPMNHIKARAHAGSRTKRRR